MECGERHQINPPTRGCRNPPNTDYHRPALRRRLLGWGMQDRVTSKSGASPCNGNAGEFFIQAKMLTSSNQRPGASYIQAAASSVAVAPQGQVRRLFNRLKNGAGARGRFVCPSSRGSLRPAVGSCAIPIPPPSGHVARLASVFRVASRVNAPTCIPVHLPLLKRGARASAPSRRSPGHPACGWARRPLCSPSVPVFAFVIPGRDGTVEPAGWKRRSWRSSMLVYPSNAVSRKQIKKRNIFMSKSE